MKKLERFLPLAYILTACVPLLATLMLVQGLMHTSISAFVPVYSDEIDYWHETATFLKAGFGGGYYTINEIPATASFTPFGPHGPSVIVFFGLIGKIIGWNYDSPFILNLGIITLALLAFLLITRPRWGQLGLIAAFFAVCWPVLFFLPTGMEETLNQVGGILFAALIFIFLRDGMKNSIWLWITILLLAFFCSIRYTWIFLVPVFALAGFRKIGWKKGLWMAAACVVIIGAGFYLVSIQYAPYPNSFTSSVMYFLKRSVPEAIKFFWEHLRDNLTAFFPAGNILQWETMERIQVVGVSVYLAVLVFVYRRKPESRLAWVVLAALIPIIAAQILFYEIRRLIDVRIFAPYLIFAVLLIVTSRPHGWAWVTSAVILGNVILVSSMMQIYPSYHNAQFYADISSIEATSQQLAPYIQYKENAPRWCNSVTTTLDQKELMGVPAGVGITYVMDATGINYPLDAKYTIFRNSVFARSKPVHLQKLAQLDIGYLFLNLNAKCP
jgi:hypothetical protein